MNSFPASIKLSQSPYPTLQIENSFASAHISLLGGHILSFVPKHDNRERLWLSPKAVLDGSRSIRGGIPICWPWFGNHSEDKYPAHGYVRTQNWTCLKAVDESTYTEITLAPENCQGEGFNGSASLSLIIRIGEELSLKLKTTNTGSRPCTYTCALHTYFNINDINTSELFGLSGKYSDKPQNYAIFETPDSYQFINETDRIHLNPSDKVSIVQSTNKTEIYSKGHDSIVVWNPWSDNSKAMSDMEDDAYKYMLCVETAITQGQKLEADESHLLQQIIK